MCKGALKNIFLFGWARSLLWHVGSSSLTREVPGVIKKVTKKEKKRPPNSPILQV